jgi:hypothetical protein
MNPEEENETKQTPDPQNLRTAYTELCNSYRAIDDFRAFLLGALPLASGTGIFLLYSDLSMKGTKTFLLPIGIFGWIITLGLFAYEIYGIKKCCCIIKTGISMEKRMGISGQFCNRPRAVGLPIVGDFINEPLASGIIYPAVLASWTFLALIFSSTQIAGMSAVLIFILFFKLSIDFKKKLESPGCKDCLKATETSP